MTFWRRKPKREMTLRATMNQVLLVTLALVAVVSVGILFAYAQIKQTLVTHSLVASIEKDTAAQVEALMPSFLVPEQRSGATILLERFKAADGLESIAILPPGQPLPAPFSACKASSEATHCADPDGKRIAFLVPIREGSQVFGHLMKVKQISNPFTDDTILHMIEAASSVLVLVFLGLFVFSSRITAREIPDELSNLAAWVEAVLNDRASTKLPRLRFTELNSLAAQIGQILERHEKARDQAVVGQLTSGIMHDLKTPIHPIVVAHGMVAEQEPGSPKRLQRLENLFRACTANLPLIGGLVESTLDSSRQIHVERQPADLRKTITDAIALHAPAIKHRRLSVEVELGEHPLVVPHDPIQLGRVFSNVLKNSIDALDDPGATTPNRARRVRFALDSPTGGGIHIQMEDSGPGLPADPEKVFRVFRSSKPRGSGLGLMISRKIVEAHGGQMSASPSDRLAGARFDVFLPRDGGVEQSKEATSC
jgi:signal transduction histidine kinase